MTIPAEGKALVKTEIAIALPEGCYGRVGEKEVMEDRASSVNLFVVCVLLFVCSAPRSSLSWKHHIDVGGM